MQHDADANAPAGLSPGLPRVRTTVGTVLIPVFRCLGVGSSTHLDTCVHEGGVRVDPELRLSLPRVYTMAGAMLVPVFLVSNGAGPSTFRVVCARALRETRIFHPDLSCPTCARRQEQIWRFCAGFSRSGRLQHLRVHMCSR